MKKLILILMVAFSMQASAQQKEVDNSTAGDHLIKARDNFLCGFYYGALGGGVMMLSNLSSMRSSDPANDRAFRTAVTVTGGAIICVGIVYNVLGCVELGRAGKKMNELKMGVTPDGLTVRVKF